MPPNSKKRKTTAAATDANRAQGSPTPHDRATWPGWVEMESEPAFFNVMLKEMDVRGVKVQEVYSLDDDMLAILPQPVHALIFLFRYKKTEQDELETSSPKDIWFANQVPDFACATVAMLNIVNNIPGLEMGKELRDFKSFTQDMDPLSRGDAIDGFEYVKRIHNSFARETDLLQANVHMKQKAAKARKKRAAAEGVATKAASKAAANTPLKEKPPNVTSTPARSSGRLRRPTSSASVSTSNASAPGQLANIGKKRSKPARVEFSPDSDFETPSKRKSVLVEEQSARRRSERKPKPRPTPKATSGPDQADEEGFHFCAYMPINGHVWKLDGMDRFPEDMGSFDAPGGGDWMNIAQPALQGRMAQYEAGEIEFNLMAVVHDPLMTDRRALVRNVKALQAVNGKLDEVYDEWRAMDGAETKKEVFTDVPIELGATKADLDGANVPKVTQEKLAEEQDLLKLRELRTEIIAQQAGLRATVRDELRASEVDDEKARHRRHDYSRFLKGWLCALVEEGALSGLMDDHD